jgi:hypothetical protein
MFGKIYGLLGLIYLFETRAISLSHVFRSIPADHRGRSRPLKHELMVDVVLERFVDAFQVDSPLEVLPLQR